MLVILRFSLSYSPANRSRTRQPIAFVLTNVLEHGEHGDDNTQITFSGKSALHKFQAEFLIYSHRKVFARSVDFLRWALYIYNLPFLTYTL